MNNGRFIRCPGLGFLIATLSLLLRASAESQAVATAVGKEQENLLVNKTRGPTNISAALVDISMSGSEESCDKRLELTIKSWKELSVLYAELLYGLNHGSCDERLEHMTKSWRELRRLYGELHCAKHGVGE